MTVKQDKTGKYKVHVEKQGLKRVRRTFDSKKEAEDFEREYLNQLYRVDAIIDKRTLKELVDLWFVYHGVNLSDGERRKRCLLAIARELNNPVACLLTAEQFVSYRHAKLQGSGNKEGLSVKTFNNHHGYLSAVFEKLFKLGVVKFANPIAAIDFVKVHERQLSYLSHAEIDILMNSLHDCVNPSTYWVAQICLRTGARWGEVEQLRYKQLRGRLITFEFTKSKKTRSIPLDAMFFEQLLIHIKEFNPYPQSNDRVFGNCIGSFRRAVVRSGLHLPEGQCSHILRHTFASFFMMNGGNVLSLQRILGHSDIGMTMRYAHLASDHLQDAVKLNPIGCCNNQ